MHGTDEATGMLADLQLSGSVAQGSGNWTARKLARLESRLGNLGWLESLETLDLAGVRRMDTSGAWVLMRLLNDLDARNQSVALVGLSPESNSLLELVRNTCVTQGRIPQPPPVGMLERIAKSNIGRTVHVVDLLSFMGEISAAFSAQTIRPGRIRWREVAVALSDAGHKALVIVGVLAFLLGVVIAYQGGIQLRQYGAAIFVADLVGLSMIRELAPLITAIIVAGRTGSAYTAQIGTMKVTEEIDALRSIGIPPMEILVLPKILALVIALPLLTVYADVMGILGGMVMAGVQLDIGFTTYLARIEEALTLDSYLVGIGKSPVFAVIIATLGCYHGFQVSGSAESVGWRTTQSVVQSIIAVIVVDAAFSVAFSYLGI